jgi:hypothetical protein
MHHTIVGDWLMHHTIVGDWLVYHTIVGDWLIYHIIVGDSLMHHTIVGDQLMHHMPVGDQSMHHVTVGDQLMHHVTTMLHDIFVYRAGVIRKDISFFSGMTPNNQNSKCEQRAMLFAESLLPFGLEFLSSCLLSKNVSFKTHKIRIGLLFYMGVKLGQPH